jgi:tetratricopeptide (TPR) repeat protein
MTIDTSFEKTKKYFDYLMSGPSDGSSPIDKIKWAGQCIDCAETLAFGKEIESSRTLLDKAQGLLGEADEANLPKEIIANTLHYYLGGLLCGRVHLERLENKEPYFAASDSVAQSIYRYRLCLTHEMKPLLDPTRHSEVLTNLANILNSSGRFIEAIETWRESLLVDPNNGMALANIGQGFYHYGGILQDRGHRLFLQRIGYESVLAGLKPDMQGVHTTARNHFEGLRDRLQKLVGNQPLPSDMNKYSLGESKEEQQYRKWVLSRVLFLNPLNDAVQDTIAASDILSLPNTIVSLSEENHTPWRHGLFDQLKQEFVSARFLYYEGIHSKGGHYSDRDVRMFNSLDYPAYGIGTEKLKAAYRGLFSILDKLAFFLNFYLGLQIPERDVYFQSFWYVDRKPKGNRLRPEITTYKNWPLMGLYWLSRDLALDESQEVLEPAMQDMKDIRNSLEHKFLRLHTERVGHEIQRETPLSMDLARPAFEEKGLRLLRLVRAALIYLHGSVYIEESRKRKDAEENGKVIPPLAMDIYKDNWKR